MNTPGVAKYVRAELHGAEGISYTNPFGLREAGNQRPVVSAGSTQSLLFPNAVTLDGSASDDGLPNPPAALTLLWEQVGGEGSAAFADASAAQTTATFSEPGSYVLRLTATDGELSASSEITITVLASLPGTQVGPVGSGVLSFGSLPPASEWATSFIGSGKDGFTTAAGLDAAVQALDQLAVAETLISDTSSSPTKRNRAVWTSGGSTFIQLCSTSVGAVLLKGTLVNDSGEPISTLRVAYDYTVSGTQPEQVPGLRVFHSLTGAPGSWTLIPEFSGLMESAALETTLTFGTPWQPGTQMFLMWADDNADANDERKFRIDNFAATPDDLPLAVALTQPADGATLAKNQDVTVAATVAGGTAPYTVRFFAAVDGGVLAQVGADITVAPYHLNLGPLTPGNYSFHADVADASSGSAVSATRAITVANLLAPVTGGSDCAAGTDADQTFGGIVGMGGVTYYGSAGWTVEATFAGLDPNGVYEFATSANRNNASYQNRRSVYTLLGVDAFHAASTAGVVVDGASATFNTGDNTANGYVARWIGIRPGADGSFVARATHAADAESGRKAYAFDVFMLRKADGFTAWAQRQGLRGSAAEFGEDSGNGIPRGLAYALGENLVPGEPVIDIQIRNGRPVVDIPAQLPSTVPHVRVALKGCTDLAADPAEWTLTTQPAQDTEGKPSHREWLEPETPPEKAFFKLEAEKLD